MLKRPLEIFFQAYVSTRTYTGFNRHGAKEAGSVQKHPSKTVQHDLSYATSLVLVERWISNHAG